MCIKSVKNGNENVMWLMFAVLRRLVYCQNGIFDVQCLTPFSLGKRKKINGKENEQWWAITESCSATFPFNMLGVVGCIIVSRSTKPNRWSTGWWLFGCNGRPPSCWFKQAIFESRKRVNLPLFQAVHTYQQATVLFAPYPWAPCEKGFPLWTSPSESAEPPLLAVCVMLTSWARVETNSTCSHCRSSVERERNIIPRWHLWWWWRCWLWWVNKQTWNHYLTNFLFRLRPNVA